MGDWVEAADVAAGMARDWTQGRADQAAIMPNRTCCMDVWTRGGAARYWRGVSVWLKSVAASPVTGGDNVGEGAAGAAAAGAFEADAGAGAIGADAAALPATAWGVEAGAASGALAGFFSG